MNLNITLTAAQHLLIKNVFLLTKMIKFHLITVIRSSSDCSQLVILPVLCVYVTWPKNWISWVTLWLSSWAFGCKRREEDEGISHEALVNWRQGVHQGLNLFSQFVSLRVSPLGFFFLEVKSHTFKDKGLLGSSSMSLVSDQRFL